MPRSRRVQRATRVVVLTDLTNELVLYLRLTFQFYSICTDNYSIDIVHSQEIQSKQLPERVSRRFQGLVPFLPFFRLTPTRETKMVRLFLTVEDLIETCRKHERATIRQKYGNPHPLHHFALQGEVHDGLHANALMDSSDATVFEDIWYSAMAKRSMVST